MSNKVFNHKLTVLSVSLLALFLGGCAGGTSNVSVNNGNAQVNGKPSTDASAGTDAGKGTGSDAGKGTDTGATDAGKGTDTGATDAGKGTDTGATDAGKGTDTGATDAGKGIDVTPPKPEVKTPELIKADNPNLPTENLLGAKKSYTELSGYSFNAGFVGSAKETKGLLAEEESEGENGKEKVNFNSAIKTGNDGQPFVADTGVVGEQSGINVKKNKDNPNFNGNYYAETDDYTKPKSYMVQGATESNWKDDSSKGHILFIQDFRNTTLGAMRLSTKANPSIKEDVFFYRAGNPSSSIPTTGKVVYHGGWLYATKAFNDASGTLHSGDYKNYLDDGRTDSIPTIKLIADFGTKALTGNFNSAKSSNGDKLDLVIPDDKPVKIAGNGFSGHAVVQKAEDTNNPNHYKELPVGSEVDVTGAFYGGNVNNIGGYLHKGEGENQVFAGVFAGQSFVGESDPDNYKNVKPAENDQPYIDSILKVDQASGKVDLSEPQFTGDIDKLNLGDDVGVALTGIKDTGIDFQFLRLSNFAQDGSSYKFNQASLGQNGDTGYFIQGYLSSSDDVIALGQQYNKVYFAGKWLGWGKAGDKTTSAHYADARYVADFSGSDKVLDGWLYKPGSTDVSDDVKADIAKAQKAGANFEGVSLHTHIDGNSFHTNISDKTSKVNLDGVQGNIEAKGHFFGTKDNPANELGGTVVGVDGTQFGGVFAGKQVKGQSEKR